jgi:hypothetical protein
MSSTAAKKIIEQTPYGKHITVKQSFDREPPLLHVCYDNLIQMYTAKAAMHKYRMGTSKLAAVEAGPNMPGVETLDKGQVNQIQQRLRTAYKQYKEERDAAAAEADAAAQKEDGEVSDDDYQEGDGLQYDRCAQCMP